MRITVSGIPLLADTVVRYPNSTAGTSRLVSFLRMVPMCHIDRGIRANGLYLQVGSLESFVDISFPSNLYD